MTNFPGGSAGFITLIILFIVGFVFYMFVTKDKRELRKKLQAKLDDRTKEINAIWKEFQNLYDGGCKALANNGCAKRAEELYESTWWVRKHLLWAQIPMLERDIETDPVAAEQNFEKYCPTQKLTSCLDALKDMLKKQHSQSAATV